MKYYREGSTAGRRKHLNKYDDIKNDADGSVVVEPCGLDWALVVPFSLRSGDS
jgi:hypothetical protein